MWWQVPYWAPLTGPCSVAWAPPLRSWRPRPPALPAPPAPSAQPTAKHTRTKMESGLGAARRRGFFVPAGVVTLAHFSWSFCLRILELKCNKNFIKNKKINYRLQKLIPGAGAAQRGQLRNPAWSHFRKCMLHHAFLVLIWYNRILANKNNWIRLTLHIKYVLAS